MDQIRHEHWRNDPVPTRPLEPGPIPAVPCAHLRADDRAPDLVDHRDEADAGGSRAESGEGRARTERRPALDSSSTCRGGGAVRLRPRPSPASAASAACIGASSTTHKEIKATRHETNKELAQLTAHPQNTVTAEHVHLGHCIRQHNATDLGSDRAWRSPRPIHAPSTAASATAGRARRRGTFGGASSCRARCGRRQCRALQKLGGAHARYRAR
jgi:hypothetical protein